MGLWTLAMAALLLGPGCDGEGSDSSAMVMQPGQVATRPVEDPATNPAESPEAGSVPVQIVINGEPYEFPPARIYLKRQGNRVRARLLSDDPPEALSGSWSGDSFFFEMDLELPPREQLASLDDETSRDISPRDLEAAEWVFSSDSSERSQTRSGIFLGGKSHLQPVSVSVLFDQVDETTVMVTLEGIFAEFDLRQPTEMTARRKVRVQAVLPADALAY